MPNIYKGVGCHWGVSSSTVSTVTGKFQSRDHSKKSETDAIKDGDGVTVGKVYFDPTEEASFEYIPTSVTVNGDLTPTLPAIGDLLTVTDTKYTAIAATNWLVEDVSTKSSNSAAMRVSLKLTKYPQITS